MSLAVVDFGQTEVVLLKQIIEAYGFTPNGDTEIPLLSQIAQDVCGISTANLGETEIPLLSQIASYYGISTATLGETEIPLLSQIVLNLPGTTYTVATLGDTEIPLLTQWLDIIANQGSNWILATGFWNDTGVWDDASSWID